ncbi:MAG: hypothetical protein AAFW70_27385 [Cyanobacteria bacterium J06635_10]
MAKLVNQFPLPEDILRVNLNLVVMLFGLRIGVR